MRDFFRYVTDIPADSGFEMFGICHLVWLAFIAICSVVLALAYRRAYVNKDLKRLRAYRLVIGISMPLIAIYRDTVLAVTGHFDRYYLPLHLCGMALYIGALYCLTAWRFAGVVYVLLCVPGAISALIYPDWTAYPLWNYMHIHDFLSHGLIAAWGLCLIVSGEIVPLWKELWMPVVFGISGIVILTPVNKLLGTNYWFLEEPSIGSPLEAVMSITGNKWYVAGYILFVLMVVVIWLFVIRSFAMIYLKDVRRCDILTDSDNDI